MTDSIDYAALLSERFPEVGYREFYRDLFPSGTLQRTREAAKGEYPAIAVVVRDGGNIRRTVTDDLSAIDAVVADARPGDLCVMSPVTYAGMTQRKSMAHALHAIVIDLDDLIVRDGSPDGYEQLLYQFTDILGTPSAGFAIPRPTYIVASGTGLHLYYVLDEPLVLWSETFDRLEVYRAALTRKVWNAYITEAYEKPQYEGCTQGFRMVGTPVKPKAGCGVARAFLTGDKVALGYMDGFVLEGQRMGDLRRSGRVPIDVAKEKWPEWYRRRIVQGVPRGTWRPNRAVYDWWKRRVEQEGSPGHRYNCIVALAAYARKCGIERDELERDAEELRVLLHGRDTKNPFTKKDVRDALTAYRDGMIRYPIDEIVKRTGIPIEKNKRNGRKQEVHLMGARAIQEINDRVNGTNWRDGNGRKPKRDTIRAYAAEHLDESQREIARALGVSKTTVNKWLKPGWREEWEADRIKEDARRFESLVSADLARPRPSSGTAVEYSLLDLEKGSVIASAGPFDLSEE